MGENLDKLQDNLSKIETLSKRLVTALGQRPASDAGLQGPGQDIYMKAGVAYLNAMITNPTKLFEHQVQYWGKALTHFLDAQQELAKGHFTPPEDTAPNDKRFSNPLWQGHPYFNFVKQQYFFLANAIRQAVEDLEDLDPADKKRIEFLATQVIDLFSPTNYLATNPDALERAVKTDGQSLVQGLENLVRDIETHRGEALPTLADPNAFEIGKNIATTKGAVVFRNDMMEVIQYAPTTDTVHRIPLVIFPPWINKFYILDLKPGNSLIKWLVDQGYTLFIVSWKNPDQTYADMGLEDYVEKGYLTAIETAKTITQQTQVNVVGYCIAGTALALTLALLKKRGDQSVRSASFFTTLTDFSDHGEFTPFLQNDFVDAIERQVQAEGILDSHYMSKTFSFLRANDLIYGPAVRSYMMGEAPPVFDLLYWNGDSTNLPGKMALQYLRNLCQRNQFADTGLAFLDTTLRLSDINLPICAVACETDHIAAWKDSFQGVVRMGSRNKTFILAESGHIAGIVNPPAKNKYGYYIGSDARGTPDAWQARATYTKGSWWPYWEDWLSKRAGKHVAARNLDEDGQNILAPAPGTYVLEKAGG
mgnify:FL=1